MIAIQSLCLFLENKENDMAENNNNEAEQLGLEGFDIAMPDFNVDFDLSVFEMKESTENETRYIKPRLYKPLADHQLKYDNAVKLVRDLKLEPGQRADVIVSGTFIFGDFIEAFIRENNIKIPEMTITTLSMSQANIDSLANLMADGYVDNLNLIVSYYFFAHERHVLVPYIYENLDIDNRFQLAVAASHTKTVIFETKGGKKVVMQGSANLRSSNNLEQFTIEENADLYDFFKEYQSTIIEKYKTINKPTLGKELFKMITTKKFK